MHPRTRLRLLAADLHYPDELVVHTATSGAIAHLAARILVIERTDGFSGLGEVRANIPYLTHMPEEAVAPAIRDLCRRLPWPEEPQTLVELLPELAATAPNIARAAVENALVEGLARAAGKPVAAWLGGQWKAAATNQCLFWGPDERFDRLADRFVGEGFRDLKVRIAVGDFEHDLARLGRLRARFGDSIRIAVDANGAWPKDEAVAKLRRLESFDLAYVEQPTTPSDWGAFRAALAATAIPLMLDESLMTDADIERLAEIGPPALAHLKIVKLGGPLAVMRAARKLAAAGGGIMVGQMNEGGLATALTAHCAMALNPKHAELYGCYGLLDDVASGLSYEGGAVMLPATPGLGVRFEPERCALLWEETF
jgi:L-alanine-DL-glutamate epimerase-like enolase superfamily enzyme